MESRNQKSHGGNADITLDYPVYSRLFIVCDRKNKEEDFRDAFSKFGQIEDIKIPYDSSGRAKGVCFIKFSKTSEAANALEAMHMTRLPGSPRFLKVSVAVNRSEVETKDDNDEKYKRLFINIPKSMKEEELEPIFAPFGRITSLLVQRDQNSGESKGFAYVTYDKFSEAANAFEKCGKQYRAIFAKPKWQRSESHFQPSNYESNNQPDYNSLISMMDSTAKGFTKVHFLCSPFLGRFHMEKLFGLIPGMVGLTFFSDLMENCGKGTASYSNSTSAAYAVDKLDQFEYPGPGQYIYVKPDTSSFCPKEKRIADGIPNALANLKNAVGSTGAPDLAKLTLAIKEAQKLVKAATGSHDAPDNTDCSVVLPPPQPLADIDSKVAKRCFLVCKPSPPPLSALRDVFCRFGNLINVYTLPNKTVGYARYASEDSANKAIQTLHGAEVCGVRIKVLEAEDEAPPKKRRYD